MAVLMDLLPSESIQVLVESHPVGSVQIGIFARVNITRKGLVEITCFLEGGNYRVFDIDPDAPSLFACSLNRPRRNNNYICHLILCKGISFKIMTGEFTRAKVSRSGKKCQKHGGGATLRYQILHGRRHARDRNHFSPQ
jgi:hypothetical protein